MPTNITFSKYEPVDEGTYHVKVTGFNERTAAKGPSRDPFLAWDLEILNNPKYPNKKVSFAMGYNIGPNAMGTKFLKALGWIPPQTPGDLQLDPNNFIGRECFAKFSKEKSANGTETNKMKEVWSIAEMQGIVSMAGGSIIQSPGANFAPPTPKFDPNTGQPIVPAAPVVPAAPKFDPNTGQPIVPVISNAPKFDPNTGLPLTQAPVTPKFDPNTGLPLSAPTGGERTYEPVAPPITRTPTGIPNVPPAAPVIPSANNVVTDQDDMVFPK